MVRIHTRGSGAILILRKIDASRVNNLPTGGAATTWATIDRPEWTNQFSWSYLGPFISPAETTNFDVITSNSITPVSHQVYNLGQRFRRYNVVHTENLNLTTAIFDNGARHTYFSGSYNELRDKPEYFDQIDFFSGQASFV